MRKINFEMVNRNGKKVYSYHKKSLEIYSFTYGFNSEIVKTTKKLHKDEHLFTLDAGVYFIALWPENI